MLHLRYATTKPFARNPRLVIGDGHFTFKQWAGALAAANRLAIPRIREYVSQRLTGGLDRLDPFDCVDAALQYREHEWLFEPFLRICERPEALSPAEILRLGPERSGAVGRVREKLLKREGELKMAWLREQWPTKVTKLRTIPQPDWAAMSTTVRETLAVEAERLFELETLLSKPDFSSPSLAARSSTGSDPRGTLYPKYGQSDLRTMKVRSLLISCISTDLFAPL